MLKKVHISITVKGIQTHSYCVTSIFNHAFTIILRFHMFPAIGERVQSHGANQHRCLCSIEFSEDL